MQTRLCSQAVLLTTVAVACSDVNFLGKPPKRGLPPGRIFPGENAEKIVTFKSGEPRKPELADFLFVLDNSRSMDDDARGVAEGLAAVPASSFPADSRLGVMTTMTAKSTKENPLIVHQDIYPYPCINKEPGFLDLVNAKAISDWRSCRVNNKQSQTAYALAGCTEGWFKPFEENTSKERCFTAAMQNIWHNVQCEAGLRALEQFLERKRDTRVFREGAFVTVAFISDEQEGCKSPETLGDPSDASAEATRKRITDAIVANSKASGVRFTGIIPEAKLVPANTLSYQKVIELAGGKYFRITEARTNYKEIVEKIVNPVIVDPSKEFPLLGDVTSIVHVKVDGKLVPASSYELVQVDGRSMIRIKGVEADREVEISVAYKTR